MSWISGVLRASGPPAPASPTLMVTVVPTSSGVELRNSMLWRPAVRVSTLPGRTAVTVAVTWVPGVSLI